METRTSRFSFSKTWFLTVSYRDVTPSHLVISHLGKRRRNSLSNPGDWCAFWWRQCHWTQQLQRRSKSKKMRENSVCGCLQRKWIIQPVRSSLGSNLQILAQDFCAMENLLQALENSWPHFPWKKMCYLSSWYYWGAVIQSIKDLSLVNGADRNQIEYLNQEYIQC